MRGAGNSAANKSLLISLLSSGIVLVLLSIAFSRLPGLGTQFVVISVVLFAIAGLSLAVLARRRLDLPKFGPANAVTLLRVALTAMLSALLFVPVSDAALWFCIGVATCTLLLDGVDGGLARRFSTQSRFGARFDMEVDAALIMVLALLAWHFERAGVWVLTAGLLRYVFVAAAVVLPWLRAPLPPSQRRKTVCILQSTLLLVCMGPIVAAALAPWIAASGVALLGWSFALDVVWLYTRRSAGTGE